MKLINTIFTNLRYAMQYSMLVLLFATFSLHTMEPQEIKQIAPLNIEQLPDEINQKIILYLTSSADNLKEAADNIKSLFRTNKFFARFANDAYTHMHIVQELAQRFTNGDLLEAAIVLNTPGAATYIASIIKNDKVATKLGENLLDAVYHNMNHLINFLAKVHKHTQFPFIDKQDKYNGYTALILAAKYNKKKPIIRQLIAMGADVNKKDKCGRTALIQIIGGGVKQYKEKVRYLVEAGTNVNTQYEEGKTALMVAASLGKREVIEQLLNAGADVNKQDECGITALIQAVIHGNQKVIEQLLEAGADVNKKNRNGHNALWYAVFRSNVAIAQQLLEAGADANQKDRYGLAVSEDILKSKEFKQLRSFLLKQESKNCCKLM